MNLSGKLPNGSHHGGRMAKFTHRNQQWNLDHDRFDWNRAQLGMLMDICDELKKLNTLLHCSNFTAIPGKLDRIRIATARIPAKRKAARRAT